MTARPKLTESQQRVFTNIRSHVDEFGMPPTRKEVADELGIAPNAVTGHLVILQRKGYIELLPGKSRGLRIL